MMVSLKDSIMNNGSGCKIDFYNAIDVERWSYKFINKLKAHMERKRGKLCDEFTDSGAVNLGYTQAIGEMLRCLKGVESK